MSILKLPSLFQRSEEVEQAYHLALVVYKQSIQAAVWTIAKDTAKIVGTGADTISAEGWIEAAKKAIDEAAAGLKQDVTRVIFGVPDHWIANGNLRPTFATQLRSLCKELHLVPTSFVSTIRAIAHAQKLKEGMPLTAIVVGVEDKSAEISLWQTGRLIGVAYRDSGASIAQTIDETIKTFGEVEVLPTRMFLYGTGDLASVKQSLLAYPWMQRLNFLHFPKIDLVPAGTPAISVALTGASDLGMHRYAPTDASTEASAQVASDTPFGFVRGKDIAATTTVQNQPQKIPLPSPVEPKASIVRPRFTWPRPSVGTPDEQPTSLYLRFGVWPLRIGIAASILAIGVAGLAALYWNLPKATVALLLQPEVLERDTQILISPSTSQVDVGAKVLPGVSLSVSQKSSKKGTATGQKVVGDSAKGEVTIFNKSSSLKKLAKGTVLVAQGSGLTFQFEHDVDVASQSATTSADESVTLTPGKSKASVAASVIGDTGNLAAGTEFAIGSFSLETVKAKSEKAFSGGNSRQVAVVTKEDQEKLVTSLTQEMLEKDKGELSGKLTEGQVLVTESLKQSVVKKSFDRDSDKEASDLTVTIETTTIATAYNETDLKELLRQSVATAVPEGFELLTEAVDTTTQVSRVEDGGNVVLKVHFLANLLPKLSDEEIKNAIAGKKLEAAREVLLGFPRVAEVSFHLWPKLPDALLALPHRKDRITIERAHR